MRLVVPLALLAFASRETSAQDFPKFMGRQVTVTEPEIVDDFVLKGRATVCLEGPPQRQCYTAPEYYGRRPTVAVIRLEKGESTLFFSAESVGVSGFSIHFALLRSGTGQDLLDLFPDLSLSNQSQHAFWNDSTISGDPMFVTAEYEYGPNEGHYGEHRYTISVYTRKDSAGLYDLEDRYTTVKKYDLEKKDILAAEKQEILARLKRVKASRH